MALVLQLLGAMHATWQGAPLKFATDHTRALFAYLAVEADTFHMRSQLATLLWPEENETNARHNLRQALFFLRQSLSSVPTRDELLTATPTQLHWRNTGSTVDLHAFQQSWQVSQSHHHAPGEYCPTCLEALTQAAAYYQGEFLHGLLLKANPLFEEWVLFRREQAHHQAMSVLNRLAAHYLAIGNYAGAQPYAARQVALESWHEEGHRQLMSALAAQGQQSAALRQYERCRQILEEELGTPPAPETTDLYEQIRAGNFQPTPQPLARHGTSLRRTDVATASSPNSPPLRRHNLPATLAPLVGRSPQLVELRTLLHDPGRRLITIVGMGGMGKSRLALALVEELATAASSPFRDGFWFVRLAGMTPDATFVADGLAGAILHALALTPTQTSLQDLLFHYLAERQLLIVLDCFEELLVDEQRATAATDFLRALLQAAPGVTLLVTSRRPLQLLAESILRLEGLPTPPPGKSKLDLRDGANYESIRLFVYHAHCALPTFTLSETNLPTVVELCRSLSGIPLAIELAAALVPHFTPEELVEAVRQNLALLTSTRRDLDARHRQFSAVLHSSWQLLTVREQEVLAQCAIFVGPFSRAAAQAVTGATVSELSSLVEKALIQQPGIGIYQLHDLLRTFAAHQLTQQRAELEATADRHSQYYLDFVAQREQPLARHSPRQAIAAIQGEVDNVRQAWRWAATHAMQPGFMSTLYQRLTASAYSLWQFYLITGLYAEGAAAFHLAATGVEALCAALREQGTAQEKEERATNGYEEATFAQWQRLRSRLLAFAGYLLATQGQHDAAMTVAQQAVGLGVLYASHEGECLGLASIAQVHYYQGQWEPAKNDIEQLQQRLQQIEWGAQPPEAYYDAYIIAYIYAGVIAKNSDQYALAQSYITRVLQLCQPLGKLRGVMHARLNLANLARYKQDYATARREYEQALQIAAELGYRRGEAITRYELADVMRGQGEYVLALAELTQAVTILRDLGEPFHENYTAVDSGRLYLCLGNHAEAKRLIEQALAHSAHLTLPDAILESWLAAALLYLAGDEAATALDYASRSQAMAQTRGNRRYEGCAWLYMGDALRRVERWPAAQVAYTNALALLQQLDIQPVVAEALAGLAQVALAQGDQRGALTWVDATLAIMATHAVVGLDEPFAIYFTCYQVLSANRDPRAAAILQQGAQILLRYADRITDPELRHSFLSAVAPHRALDQAYQHAFAQATAR
jgi:predicted ATPase/DNA-binding SARP family transcriptional activator